MYQYLETPDSTPPTSNSQERSSRSVVPTLSQEHQPFHSRNDVKQMLEGVNLGFELEVSIPDLLASVDASTYAGISEQDQWDTMIMAARANIENEPSYSFVAARLLLVALYNEVLETTSGTRVNLSDAAQIYSSYFPDFVQKEVEAGLLDRRLLEFDLASLASAIRPERDLLFAYAGLQTLYDRYLLQNYGRRVELPQLLWMRVAMGLALNETQREARTVEFYEVISQFYFTPASPTLYNAGTCHPQLSSCYLTTIEDNLNHIFKCFQDNAQLLKWSGGLGNDWTNVRALGAPIRGTNGRSQGVIPFLKIANDTVVAVNQMGKLKSAACAYLENWHLDIEDFLDLRKNTGDDRRHTHDMSTACWISDLFMQRVERDEIWTLFNPDDVPDLHELYGKAFVQRYCEYEQQIDQGKITHYKRLPAVSLWRKMLTRLFETGHPWITWKDPSNIRSPQDHAGVIHSSNLCTEILLNTSSSETGVCNLGSINLAAHIVNGCLDSHLLMLTIGSAMRMLDNVIDINYYPTSEAHAANLRHRPVGLGLMGFQDALYKLGLSYASQDAIAFADLSMEIISYYTILSSANLAKERGTYPSYAGSKWHRGLLPLDTIDLLLVERGEAIEMDRSSTLDWDYVREVVQQQGMRNSNVLAIAPTATIATIAGVSQSIEPSYKNLHVKSSLSGEFIHINKFLVNDLKQARLWNAEMLEAIKYFDGSLQEIPSIPAALKQRYLTAFEIEPSILIECASRRQKWIDMGQSLNLYLAEPSGKKLLEIYALAWKKGLKTTYYLRTLAATQIEKSALDVNRRGIQPRWMSNSGPSSTIHVERKAPGGESTSPTCTPDEQCEACQ
jgi:ribonucleoside-diphosphate reductase alpha chain